MNSFTPATAENRALSIAVALLSGAALAYEILLMRLFSIIQWHHFAYMIISLALLGYGASGVFLAMLRDRLNARFALIFPLAVMLFSISSPVCFWLAQRIPFNPAEIFWSPQQLPYLFTLYLLLAIPFFFAATAVGLALYRYREQASSIYAADLAGAGLGCLGVIALLFRLPPERGLVILAIIAMAGLLPLYLPVSDKNRNKLALCLGIIAALLFVPGPWQSLRVSPYKELQQFLRIPGSGVIERISSPIGDVQIAKSPKMPLRHAPGLSFNADVEIPDQLAVFTDADNMTAITHYDGRPETLAYLDQTTSALPFHLHTPDDLLILGAGTGTDVLQSLFFGVKSIDAVELNPQLLNYLRDKQDAFGGGIFSRAGIRWHTGEARGFVSSSRQQFGMIQISLLDAFGASSAGLYALSENYLYTVEAFQEYLRHLKPQGYLSITRWIKMPPRDSLKLFATAVSALEGSGPDDPGRRLLMIRSWQTSTLLVKNGAVTSSEIVALKKFCDERGFDIDYYPGVTEAETNRYNILSEPYYFRAALALLGPERAEYIGDYKFDIRPATDNQPYFFKFFKWASLPEIVSLYGQGGITLLESGYILLVAGIFQALLAGALFIGLPLTAGKHKLGFNPASHSSWRMLAFFFCLGMAFLFIEIAFIQKFILFLHHPVYSVAAVLSTFLISAGTGSYMSRFFEHRPNGHWYPVAGIAATALLYLIFLKDLTALLLNEPSWFNIVVSIGLTAPLGFFMGMPFPLGLFRAGQLDPALIPWAWGVNGFASVISAMLATLIAIHLGFNILILSAAGLYILAGVCFPAVTGQDQD